MQGPSNDLPRRALLYPAIALGLALASPHARAQDAAPATDESADAAKLDAVSVVGSRRVQRSSETTTPVPVDVLPMQRQAERDRRAQQRAAREVVRRSLHL